MQRNRNASPVRHDGCFSTQLASRFLCFSAVYLSYGFLPVPAAWAQISPTEAAQMGMEVAWQSQIQLPRVGEGIVSSHLWVAGTEPKKYAVVELANKTIRVSADTLDRRGQPIGMEAAKKSATEQAARMLGKNDGFQVVEVSIPRVKLILVTRNGLVQTLDAETGKLMWATACGPSYAPAHRAAVSPLGIVLIHGEKIYLLDHDTGKVLKEKGLRFASANSVVACGDFVYVSDVTGRVEAYGIEDNLNPWGYKLSGRAIGQPVNLADQSFCAMASDKGFVYVFHGGEVPGVQLRYQTAATLYGSLAAGNGNFYVGTSSGVLTKIDVRDRLGRLPWEFRAGQAIVNPALVLGKSVFIASEVGRAFSISDEDGTALWISESVGIDQPVAQAAGKLFCTTLSGELYSLDAESGRVTARTGGLDLAKPIINQIDDRVYVLTKNGRLECLRPIGSDLPTLVTPFVPLEEEAEDTEKPATEASDDMAPTSPFGGFEAAAPAANPFGGAANPFGGEPASGSANPFGGEPAANPFGGSNPFDTP